MTQERSLNKSYLQLELNKMEIQKKRKSPLPRESPTELQNNSENRTIQIFAYTFQGKIIALDVFEDTTVLQLKNIIYEKEKIQPQDQRLTYSGRNLEDNQKLSVYNIRHCSTIQILSFLRGC